MTGQLKEFYLVALPGLEDLVQAELSDWFPTLECKADHGGVTVHAPLDVGLSMNMALKTPTRILMRLETFRCRDFPKLFHTISEYPWHNVLDTDCTIEAHASTTRSRLRIKSRIEETCRDGWIDQQKRKKRVADPKKIANLYVRFADDSCTLSLDTSGDRLHKRGARKWIGEAPLRETIAAGLIQMVTRSSVSPAPVEIFDPMMGSGTFLLEALFRDRLVESREFAFENFKAEVKTAPTLRASRAKIERLVGYEVDKKSLNNAKTNLKSIVAGCPVTLEQADIFSAKPIAKTTHQRWVFANPPYNERLKVDGPLLEYYTKLFQAVEDVAQPDRACFLLPSKAVKGKLKLPPKWKVSEKRSFLNGGISVVAFVFSRL